MRVANVLGLPEDYFPETRRLLVLTALTGDPKLGDRVYDQVANKAMRERRVPPETDLT